MINRTGLYVLKQDVACRCSDSKWTVKAGTEFEVTNVQPEKNVFYSYALGGWHKADIQAILVIPYQSEKVLIKKTGDGQSYFLSLADCSQVGDGAYKGKAIERIAQYEELFTISPIELHFLFQKMSQELNALRAEKKQFTDARRYGYHPLPGREVTEALKKEYPVGCRIVIHHVSDPFIYIPPETKATVHGVDAGGLVHVSCDEGTSVKLIHKADQFERITEESTGGCANGK